MVLEVGHYKCMTMTSSSFPSCHPLTFSIFQSTRSPFVTLLSRRSVW